MSEWTGMGPNTPAPKQDPNCQCICHTQPGVMHVAACCAPPMPADLTREGLAARDAPISDALAKLAAEEPHRIWTLGARYTRNRYLGAAFAGREYILAPEVAKLIREAEARGMERAAEICEGIRTRIANGPMPEGARFDYEQAIRAEAAAIRGEGK